MLGENAIRYFGLDHDRLAQIAARIGPTVGEINGTVTDIQPDVRTTFEMRGYYKPIEGDDRLPVIEPLLRADVDRVVPDMTTTETTALRYDP